MSEKQGELDKTLPLVPSPSDTSKNTTLAQIEERLANATTPEEITLWTQVRGEIIKQNEIIKDNKQRRSLEKIQIIRQTSLFGIALTIGVGLIISDLTVPGLFVLGAALYELAPDYLKNLTLREGSVEEHENE